MSEDSSLYPDVDNLRSRTGLRMGRERIAPEEYVLAVATVLGGGHTFPREQLKTEVRAVLGYARTGAALEEGIHTAIDRLLAAGVVGEGSNGIRLRDSGAGQLRSQ